MCDLIAVLISGGIGLGIACLVSALWWGDPLDKETP